MTILAVALAQLLDLVTFVPAILRYPSGEAGVLGPGTPEQIVLVKAIGIAAMVVILALLPPRRRVPAAAFVVAVGLFGAATNLSALGLVAPS